MCIEFSLSILQEGLRIPQPYAWAPFTPPRYWLASTRPISPTPSRTPPERMTPMSNTPAHTIARLIFDACELQYDFGHDHPFQARRLAALIYLLESSGLCQRCIERHSLPIR